MSANLDPFQREHELADAIVTLMIASSRYAADGDRPTCSRITLLVAHAVAERVRDLRGSGGSRIRKALGRRRPLCRNDRSQPR